METNKLKNQRKQSSNNNHRFNYKINESAQRDAFIQQELKRLQKTLILTIFFLLLTKNDAHGFARRSFVKEVIRLCKSLLFCLIAPHARSSCLKKFIIFHSKTVLFNSVSCKNLVF